MCPNDWLTLGEGRPSPDKIDKSATATTYISGKDFKEVIIFLR